jgi:hypothetical protein
MKILLNSLIAVVFGFVGVEALADEPRPNGPSRPAHSEYFVSVAAGVLQSRDDPASTFAISLTLNKPLPLDSTLLVEFENPLDLESPLVVVGRLNENGEMHARSPKVERIQNRRAYLVRTKILGSSTRSMDLV